MGLFKSANNIDIMRILLSPPIVRYKLLIEFLYSFCRCGLESLGLLFAFFTQIVNGPKIAHN